MQRGTWLAQTRATRRTCSDWPEVLMVGQLGSRDPVLPAGGPAERGLHSPCIAERHLREIVTGERRRW
jgi:hypothetical protein